MWLGLAEGNRRKDVAVGAEPDKERGEVGGGAWGGEGRGCT